MEDREVQAAISVYQTRLPSIAAFASALEVLLAQLVNDAEIAVDYITGRPKDAASLSKKLSNPKYSSLDEITDLCGLRIVTRHAEDVKAVVELIKHEFEILEHVVHGAESPQSFGYASEHLIVKLDTRRAALREWKANEGVVAEVQVRSILQHAWASISHGLDYKDEGDAPKALRRQLFRIAALLETSDELFDDFRRDMRDLRGEYRAVVDREEWRDLPLDFDSLQAAKDRLPWRGIAEAAIAADFDTRDVGSDADEWVDRGHDGADRRLVRAAKIAGLQSVGDLAEFMDEVVSNVELLRAFANSADAHEFRPRPLPQDVVIFALVAIKRSEATYNFLVDDGEIHFAQGIMTALREIVSPDEGGDD
ncbi:GTP pyrophosphokinase family protein [Nocardioides sp.]|uniref:GTP pyrophosphokinase n=1 Tax=Nocardioides sp. TaxID=35761 RepID=UPI0035B1BF41